MRVAYLGPAGTFSEDALRAAAGDAQVEPLPAPTIYDAIAAVDDGSAERALVPFENSIEGSVRATLDALAFDAPSVSIVGEHDQPITNSLIARRELDLSEIEVVISASAGERPVRALHPRRAAAARRSARRRAPRMPFARWPSATGPGPRSVAPPRRGSTVAWCCARESRTMRATSPASSGSPRRAPRPRGEGRWKTTLTFSELGADHPGALVEALTEFSSRAVNLTRIESRPLRQGLGRYMFFIDLEGADSEPPVAEAILALRAKAENVRLLGSYPLDNGGIPGA